MRLSVSHPVRGRAAGSSLMRRTARVRTRLQLAGLFASGAITGFVAIGSTVFSNLRAVCSWLENLLTIVSAKIQLAFIPGPICVAGKPLSHVRIIVCYSSAVLGTVLPMRDVGATVDVDLPSTPVDVST